jgi:hypothetical protein
MPLEKSASDEAIGPNITREEEAGKPYKQALAIALDTQRRARRPVGGSMTQGQWNQRNPQDPVIRHGLVHGVTPGRADSVNYSVPKGAYVLPADVVSAHGQGNTLSGARILDRTYPNAETAQNATQPLIPVALSDGEYVVGPNRVKQVGHGDTDFGHDILDQHVLKKRAEHRKVLGKLPGPVGS